MSWGLGMINSPYTNNQTISGLLGNEAIRCSVTGGQELNHNPPPPVHCRSAFCGVTNMEVLCCLSVDAQFNRRAHWIGELLCTYGP